ncbi:MAG: hypothetical protein WDA47_03240 [Bacilli bacterium]|nr:hypothetical protein [Candidatus Saccharicenans sp.]
MNNNYYKLYMVTLTDNASDYNGGDTFDIFVCVEIAADDTRYTSGFSKAAEFAMSEYPGAWIKKIEVIDKPVYPVAL